MYTEQNLISQCTNTLQILLNLQNIYALPDIDAVNTIVSRAAPAQWCY